ncbi:tRNA-uridine aminocarboxypropyltransferase [Marinomonas spartinae]|uniref:tRNA-uridine aminocarboxypropyltransferase n=1 Tax=Marinomonas spartinae TaxID=1792290 RepID=UPI0018F15194|nr:tRNA-uridine aminocarboxypropyltransferase [Marinomonas spartinae]MBJ7555114.1 DTW domain-containing protein [Marinomonas spartinae]
MPLKHPPHCVDKLRQQCQESAMRPFIARGANAIRCPSCLMAEFACFCQHRKTSDAPFQFILLFHRDEIHKPTNSGRLIADLYPNDTQAFLWHRTQPPAALLKQLKAIQGHCSILFPNTPTAQSQNRPPQPLPLPTPEEGSKHTFIVLDGTWKQASKMFHQSEWLKAIPHLEINSEAQRSFLVRHSSHRMQFATAEVVALLMDSLGYQQEAAKLLTYNNVFNTHCLNSRKRSNEKTDDLTA